MILHTIKVDVEVLSLITMGQRKWEPEERNKRKACVELCSTTGLSVLNIVTAAKQ